MTLPVSTIPEKGIFVISYDAREFGIATLARTDTVTITHTRKNTYVHVTHEGNGSGETYPTVDAYREMLRLIRADIQAILLEDGTILT